MSIKFRCEHCGKSVEAPDSAGGKRGSCPYCQQSNYIPMPVSDEEILDLAPEDEQKDARRKAEEEAILRQKQALLAEMGPRDPAEPPLEEKAKVESNDVEHFVVNYCLDLANSNLDRAQMTFDKMKRFRRACLDVTNDFLDGKKKEPALAEIPPKLLTGILTQLRKQLQALK
jgi:phage FluMu protein Com